LLVACQNGKEDVVKLLLEHGADITKADDAGLSLTKENLVHG
jgi:hypothetical protein